LQKRGFDICPSSQDTVGLKVESYSESLAHKYPRFISGFFRQFRNPILAIIALSFPWVYARGYYYERSNKQINLSVEDIGIMKVIGDNALRVWNKYKPRGNIIKLDDFKNRF
jgi:hypothetical protein